MILRTVIICLGDSLTYGSRDNPEGRGYPTRLSPMIEKETGNLCVCLNRGVAKDTSTSLLRRVYDIVKASPESQLVLLLIGTNDLKGKISPIIYQNNMKQIINTIEILGKKVLVGTLPPIDSMGMWCFPRQVLDGVEQYNKVLNRLSIDIGFQLVDFSDMEKYVIDGVHFGEEGYNEMAKRWFKGIKELI